MEQSAGMSGARRVAVTGPGLATPLGTGVKHIRSRLLAAESGIRSIDRFRADDLPCRIAGFVPDGSFDAGGFDPSDWIGSKDRRKMGLFAMYAICAASQTRDDSGRRSQTGHERERTGVLVGSGIGALPGLADASVALHERGPRVISPFFIPSNPINFAAGRIAIRHGLSGPTPRE